MKSRSLAGRDLTTKSAGGATSVAKPQELGPLLEDVIPCWRSFLRLGSTRLSRGDERGEREKACDGEFAAGPASVALGANRAKHFSFRKS